MRESGEEVGITPMAHAICSKKLYFDARGAPYKTPTWAKESVEGEARVNLMAHFHLWVGLCVFSAVYLTKPSPGRVNALDEMSE